MQVQRFWPGLGVTAVGGASAQLGGFGMELNGNKTITYPLAANSGMRSSVRKKNGQGWEAGTPVSGGVDCKP